MEMMGQNATDEEIYTLIMNASSANAGQITKEQFKRVIGEQKKQQEESNEEDTLDAFVALGGQYDKSGQIDATRLIKTIKEEFQMTIDIEKLIKDIDEDGSGLIEYDEFMQLLQSSD